MAGLSGNSGFYNVTTALAMLAGLFVSKTRRIVDHGSIPTDIPLFASIVIGTALVVGARTFVSVLAIERMSFSMTSLVLQIA